MSGFVLDAGALIAYERQHRVAALLVKQARERGDRLVVPAGVVGQVWRDGRQQARLAQLLSSAQIDVVALDNLQARAAGQLCGRAGTADAIDASVVVCARRRDSCVVTSDPDDIRHLDPDLELIVV